MSVNRAITTEELFNEKTDSNRNVYRPDNGYFWYRYG
jgi:hypothetical protein